MKKVFNLLLKNNLTISFAESITGGYLSYSLVKNSGSSKVFMGSIISYNVFLKVSLLDVKLDLINKHGVVSEEVATSMARGLKAKINSDIQVAVTGNAGPTYENNSDELVSYIAVLYKNQLYSYKHTYNSDRISNIKSIEKYIESKIVNILNDKWWHKVVMKWKT